MRPMLALIALVAFVGCTSAQLGSSVDEEAADDFSKAAFIPSDEDEVSGVSEELRDIFTPFCLKAREQFKNTMELEVNKKVAETFSVIFDSLKGVASEALFAQEKAVKLAAESLQKGEAAALDNNGDGKLSEEELTAEIEKNIDELGEEVKKPGLIGRFTRSIYNVLAYVAQQVVNETKSMLLRARDQIDFQLVVNGVNDACGLVSWQVKNQLDSTFSSTKSEIAKSAKRTNNMKLAELLNTVTIDNVGCLTTNRVNAVTKYCQMVKMFAPMAAQMKNLMSAPPAAGRR